LNSGSLKAELHNNTSNNAM